MLIYEQPPSTIGAGGLLQILRAQTLPALTGALKGGQHLNLSWGPNFLAAPLPPSHSLLLEGFLPVASTACLKLPGSATFRLPVTVHYASNVTKQPATLKAKWNICHTIECVQVHESLWYFIRVIRVYLSIYSCVHAVAQQSVFEWDHFSILFKCRR